MKKSLFFLVILAAAISLSCKKKSEDQEGASAALLEVGAISFPQEVVAYGAVKSLDEFVSVVSRIAGQFRPDAEAMVSAQVPALLQGQLLGVRDLAWLDRTKPLRFVILDTKKYKRPIVLVTPLKGGKDALMAALPENRANGKPDNETKYSTLLGEQVFVNVIRDHAVFTFDEKAFASIEKFVRGQFCAIPFNDLLDVQFSAKNFKQIAADELVKARERLTKPSEPSEGGAGGQALLRARTEWLLDLLDQTEVARLTLSYDGRELAIRLSAKVVEGRGLARFASSAQERKITLHRIFPPGGWMVFSGNFDPTLFEAWSRLGHDFYGAFLQLTEEDKKKFEELVAKALALQTGEAASYVGKDGEFPFRIISVGSVKDGVQAGKVTSEIVSFVLSKMGNLIQQQASGAPEQVKNLDYSSPKKFAEGLKPLLAEYGLDLKLREENVGGTQVVGFEVFVDQEKLNKRISIQGYERAQEIFGQRLSVAVGSDATRVFFAFGRDAVGDIVKVSKGETSAGGDNYIDALQSRAGFAVALAGYISVRELLRIWSKLAPSLEEMSQAAESAQDEMRLAFIVGAHGSSIVDAAIYVPVAGFATLGRGASAP